MREKKIRKINTDYLGFSREGIPRPIIIIKNSYLVKHTEKYSVSDFASGPQSQQLRTMA